MKYNLNISMHIPLALQCIKILADVNVELLIARQYEHCCMEVRNNIDLVATMMYEMAGL